MMENLNTQKVVSAGGLNSNVNHIELSDKEPGGAIELQNFEASLYGGYRRLSGYVPFSPDSPAVDATNAEGRVLMVSIFNNQIYAARKQQSGATYKYYNFSGSSYTAITTGMPSLVSTGVTRIRYKEFNFKGTNTLAFADGVNPACLFDGTNWIQIKVANTGADFAHAGGNQAIDVVSCVDVYRNTLFIANNNVVCYSAPLAAYDFTVANGAGQIPVGFPIKMIKPFRDALYVFGENNIKKIELKQTAAGVNYFALSDLTANIGCIAPDSVVEIDGNLIFLSQDGFRPISATDRIGDVQLEALSKKIQQLISDSISSNDMNELCSVVIRGKSQIRFFLNDPTKPAVSTFGIIGNLRGDPSSVYATNFTWEWGRIKGIRASCTASKYIGTVEYILHGDYDGNIFRQESGNTFNGNPVEAIYATPFLDFGDVCVRKTMRKLRIFVRPEGTMTMNVKLVYDWADLDKLNPATYGLETDSTNLAFYGSAVYGTDIYGNSATPVIMTTIEGTGFSVQTRYSTSDSNPPYTIQGAVYEFSVDGRK